MSNSIEWTAFKKTIFTEKEIQENELQAQLMCEIIEARQNAGYTQHELEIVTGIKQSAIARMESGNANPTIDTLLKLLVPLGMTLSIVPISH